MLVPNLHGLADAGPIAHPSAPADPLTPRLPAAGSILLVEDVEATRTGLAEPLRLRGFAVKEAADGEEGLRILRETADVAVVVLDLRMPTMDGYAFRRHQLADLALGQVPVIVFTATTDAERIRQELQVHAVLTKPLGVGELLDLVAKICPQGT